MKCDYCEIIEQPNHTEVLYEDKDLFIIVKDMVITPGQITIVPKAHHPIVEMLPHPIMEKCALLANKVSMALFDIMGGGTNILIQNGLAGGQKVPHFAIEIIPRKENDNLPLQWPPKQLGEADLEATYSLYQEELHREKKQPDQTSPPATNAKPSEPSEQQDKKSESKKEKVKPDSYLLKSVNRLP